MDEQVRRSLAESDAIGRVDAHSVDRLLGDLGDTSEVVFSLKAQEHISRQESERVGGGKRENTYGQKMVRKLRRDSEEVVREVD
jgi:hypothetical protein